MREAELVVIATARSETPVPTNREGGTANSQTEAVLTTFDVRVQIKGDIGKLVEVLHYVPRDRPTKQSMNGPLLARFRMGGGPWLTLRPGGNTVKDMNA